MRPVFVHHSRAADYEALCRFASERIFGQRRDFGPGTAMAVIDADKVAAVAVFHAYDRDAGVIQISAASDSKRWLSRPVMLAMFQYAFHTLGCQVAVCRIDPDNAGLDRILRAYGFERFYIPRLRGRDKGEAVMLLTQEAWAGNGFHRGSDYEQESTRSNAA